MTSEFAITHARVVRPERERVGVRTEDGCTVHVKDGRLVSVGPGSAPAGVETIDARGRLVTPGLVDCHTHATFLGDRAAEFGERAAGTSYLELAKRGGGIRATVTPTREGTPFRRLDRLRTRLKRLALQGVTTVEVKSGYGLSPELELELLREIGMVRAHRLPDVHATLMAAHALPPEVTTPEQRAAWVETICEKLVPDAARQGLASAVDVFVEQGAYTAEEARRIGKAAKQAGLRLHLHVDQLTDGGGAGLSAELGASSASHLERTSAEGIAALARTGTVAVLLPTSTLAAREPGCAPARALVDAGVKIALSTNLNPGTGPSESMALAFFLGAVGLQLRPDELLWAATRGGALALGLDDRGLLEPGARADLCLWNAFDVAHLPYHAGINHLRLAWSAGVLVGDRPHADAECDGEL